MRNADVLRRDDRSILSLYRRMLAARRASAALRGGDLTLLESPDDVVAYRRSAAGDERIAVVNFGERAAPVQIAGDWRVDIATEGAGEGEAYAGSVSGSQALVLRPAAG